MAIKPIDLQSNISQIIEVGRNEQARSEAIVGQQHVLEKESGEKSRLANTTLDETKKGGSAVIQDQQKQKKEEKKHEHEKESQAGEGGISTKKERRGDDRMGNFIDVLK
jgi:hypothetical protein